MGDIKLSKEQFTYLKKIQQQEIMFIVNDKRPMCEFLKSAGYVDIIDVMTYEEFDVENQTLKTKTKQMVVQITEAGKAYIYNHTSWLRTIRWEYVIAGLSLIISIITIILGDGIINLFK